MASIFKKLFGSDEEKHSHTHEGAQCHEIHGEHSENRYQSFAPQSSGHAKWHIDGCAYFWALSEALEGEEAPLEPEYLRLNDSLWYCTQVY